MASGSVLSIYGAGERFEVVRNVGKSLFRGSSHRSSASVHDLGGSRELSSLGVNGCSVISQGVFYLLAIYLLCLARVSGFQPASGPKADLDHCILSLLYNATKPAGPGLVHEKTREV